MYYKFYADQTPALNVLVTPTNNEDAPLDEGRVIDPVEEKLALPFEFTMRVARNQDGSRQETRMSVYYPGLELMRKDLVEALQDAGVDNLQIFPARITEESGDLVVDDYVVVNVIGLAACADAERSDSIPFADGVYFTTLAIDKARAGELLMFRLAESLMDVVVHEDVAKQIGAKGFGGLELILLE